MIPSSLPLSCAAVLAWLGLVGVVSEGARRSGYDTELTRKIVHIGAGHVILIAWWLAIPAWVGIAASVLFGTIALVSYWLPILPGVNSVGRKSLGTFFYAASIGLLVAWFWPLGLPQYAALGILIMTWGDGLAALIGQNYGQHLYQIWGEKKSWEGSLTMAAVSFSVCSVVLLSVQGAGWMSWTVAATVAIAATLLEAISKLGIDNLTVPLGTAALAFWLNQLL